MSLLRFVARSLLASHFVINGVKAVKDPSQFVPAVQPLADRVVPLAQQAAPAEVSDRIPTDTATLVRIGGGAQVLGGLAFATGKGRRLGATLLAVSVVPETIAAHPFWQRTDPEERAADRAHFLKNLGLLGGVVLAAVDTEGKPSLGYRAHAGAQAISKDAGKAKKKARKKAEKALSRSSGGAGDFLDDVISEGAKAIEAVLQESRESGKRASKSAQKTAKRVAKDFEDAKQKAAKQAKEWEKDAEKAAKKANKAAGKKVDDVSKKAEKVSKKAAKSADKVTDAVAERLDHIELGTN